MRLINPDRSEEYVLEAERGSPDPTTFVLGALDGRVMAHINDSVTKFEMDGKAKGATPDPVFRLGTRRWLLVKYGLRGWRGMLDATGQPVAESFDQLPLGGRSYRVVPDRIIEQMPESAMTELAEQIAQQNELAEAEKRPLVSPSS
jgi:hypothetical protein